MLLSFTGAAFRPEKDRRFAVLPCFEAFGRRRTFCQMRREVRMNHWQATAAISSQTARVFDGTLDSAQTLTVWETAGREDVLATNPEDPTMGPGVQELTREALRMMLLKPFTHKKNSVEIVGDTAVIYFEEFAEDLNRTNSFYTKLPMTDEEVNQIFFHPDKIAEFIASHTK